MSMPHTMWWVYFFVTLLPPRWKITTFPTVAAYPYPWPKRNAPLLSPLVVTLYLFQVGVIVLDESNQGLLLGMGHYAWICEERTGAVLGVHGFAWLTELVEVSPPLGGGVQAGSPEVNVYSNLVPAGELSWPLKQSKRVSPASRLSVPNDWS